MQTNHATRTAGSLHLIPAGTILVPLGFMVAGVVSLLGVLVWLMVQPAILSTYHYNQYVIAATHLAVLGWICSVVMGATYQLVPVALETTLHNYRLAKWHLGLHIIGFTGMVWMFYIWDMKQLGHFGSVFGLGIVFFVYNLGRTLMRVPRWNVIAVAIASALFWLLTTMLVGLYVASAKCWPVIGIFEPIAQMHAHAHLGVMGCFVLLTLGVSLKLVPMFALSDIQNSRRAMASIALFNLSVLGSVASVLLGGNLRVIFAFSGFAAIVLYLLELRAILRARKRRELDWGLKTFLVAISLLLPLAAVGIALSWPGLQMTALTGQLENLYGFFAIFGILTLGITGMMHKIVPFLVWYYSYSRQIGRHKVPALGDLYSVALQKTSFWLMAGGLVLSVPATLLGHDHCVRFSGGLLLLGAVAFALNIGLVLSHLLRPKLQPLASSKPRTPAVPAGARLEPANV